jgi:uncharacterized protein YaiI (UPF0178 family)
VKILVDADACPVKDIIVRLAKERSIPVIMFIDTSHVLDDGYSKVVVVEKGKDSVDIALINKVEKNDMVVTQDFGVATMAMSKKAYALNQNGLIFNENNIDRLLFERYLSQKVRRSGGRTSNPRKRTREDNEKFEKSFILLYEKICKNISE